MDVAGPDDTRLLGGQADSSIDHGALRREVVRCYPDLDVLDVRHVYTSVHDMVEVRAAGGRYALKLYRHGVRTAADVRWEVDLHRHLLAAEAPVPALLVAADGYVAELHLGDQRRLAVMSAWAPGAKPRPSETTYRLLGRAAAQVHVAADELTSVRPPRTTTLATEIDQQLELLRPALQRQGVWHDAQTLAEKLRAGITPDLERGICHNDLTLDNVHIEDDQIWVFDFDSAGQGWRASEPQGVYEFTALTGRPWWTSWLSGYREVRSFDEAGHRALPFFVVTFHLENTAWKLGLTPTSVGKQLDERDLAPMVARWASILDTPG